MRKITYREPRGWAGDHKGSNVRCIRETLVTWAGGEEDTMSDFGDILKITLTELAAG